MENNIRAIESKTSTNIQNINSLNIVDKNIFDFDKELSSLEELNENKREFFDFSTKSHLKCFPTKEAYFYIPDEKEEFELDSNNIILGRKIFEIKKGFSINEYKALQSLKSQITEYNENNLKSPLYIPDNIPESEILRILQASKFDNNIAITNIISYLDFKKSYFPMKLSEKAIEILSTTGFLYCHGRDRAFRPILICRAESYLANIKRFSYDDWLNAIVYFSEYVINYMMIPGQVETWNTIADLNNVSIINLPSDFHKFVKFLQTNYRSRLHFSFVFGMNRFLDFLWRIIKNFLHSNVEKKIVFINESNKNIIFNTILEEQLEMKYGGKAPNLFEKISNINNFIKTKSLFPPYMPENAEFQNFMDKQKLISETEYVTLFKQDKISKLSPYVDLNQYEMKNFLTCNQKSSRTKTNGI